jgi:hypothetical protein
VSKFRNAILCDDIRDEVGGKNSLMGVFSGDIVVPHFPASINIAFFLQYFPDASENLHVTTALRLMDDDKEIAKFGMDANATLGQSITIIIPRGIATFDKETTLRMVASMNGQEIEIVSKKVLLAGTTASPTATKLPSEPAPPSA